MYTEYGVPFDFWEKKETEILDANFGVGRGGKWKLDGSLHTKSIRVTRLAVKM